MAESRCASLRWAYDSLRATGRGKHIGQFSYYHVDVIRAVEGAECSLRRICEAIASGRCEYNVIKLNRKSRVSYLQYEAFTTPFPALLAALTCDIATRTCRRTDFTRRANPPILHRKELLLQADNHLVRAATELTARLEAKGAFGQGRHIGTRNGWAKRLEALGLGIRDGEVVGW